MNSKVLFGLLILALSATGCVSEFNAELPYDDTQVLVVDGSIIENTDVTFRLSKSFSLNYVSAPNVNFEINANLTIIGSDGYKSSPAVNSGKGEYRFSVGKLDDNVEYGIQIEYEGNIYQSTLSKPLHTPEIDSISWIQPEEKGAVFFRISTHDNSDGAKYFMWDYTENWEITANYYTVIFYDTETELFYINSPAPYYYCWKTGKSDKLLIGSTESLNANKIINKQLYSDDPKDNRFSVLYCVTVYQKAISRDAYIYYQNKILLNEEMGGLFTPQPSELGGNITCITDPSKKVIGYVETAKNTTRKRIFVSSAQISRPRIGGCELITQAEVDELLNGPLSKRERTYTDYYRMGYRPACYEDMRAYPKIFPEFWASASCTDCIAAGGTKNKPDYWPNDHE